MQDSNGQIKLNRGIYQVLRVAMALCFIGHGCFGLITKPIWCNYFAVFGIGHDVAYRLMPVVGSFDILMGLLILVYPVRAIPLWLIIWGFVTALLRPLSGEHFSEFIERAGNYGVPLALLILTGVPRNFRGWFTKMNPVEQVNQERMKNLSSCLKVLAFLLLLGHGGLNLVLKKGLIDQYSSLGFSDPALTARVVGLIEIAAAFTILVQPLRSMVFILFLWKMGSELFYPHFEVFEWIERGGSYGVLLALWLVTEKRASISIHTKNLFTNPMPG